MPHRFAGNPHTRLSWYDVCAVYRPVIGEKGCVVSQAAACGADGEEVETGEAGRNWQRPAPSPLNPKTQPLGEPPSIQAPRDLADPSPSAPVVILLRCAGACSCSLLLQRPGSDGASAARGNFCRLLLHHNEATLHVPAAELMTRQYVPQHESLFAVFQQLEIDYMIGMPHPVAITDLREAPIIRMCAISFIHMVPEI